MLAAATDKPYDLTVFIGRFQPFHAGHLSVVRSALDKAGRVLILVGSSNIARDTRNPFSYAERTEIISRTLGDADLIDQVEIEALPDHPYDLARWITSVQHKVMATHAPMIRPRITLTGHERDASSFYLKLFPEWDYLPADATVIEATDIRRAYFAGRWNPDAHAEVLSPGARSFMNTWRGTKTYGALMDRAKFEAKYREKWGMGPHQTVDAVIVKGGNVLLIQREDGSVGLPGGFLNLDEYLIDGAVREGIEETGLFIPASEHPVFLAYLAAVKLDPKTPTPDCVRHARAELRACLVGSGQRFDDPYRSRRGRLITEAFAFRLPDDRSGLPEVHGSDDAKDAFWRPLAEVRADDLFEDHAFIIDKLLPCFNRV